MLKSKINGGSNKMIFNDRLSFLDQCIAGEKTQFDKIVSKEAFNTFDRGYDLYRDYIKQKRQFCQIISFRFMKFFQLKILTQGKKMKIKI